MVFWFWGHLVFILVGVSCNCVSVPGFDIILATAGIEILRLHSELYR